MSKFWRGIKNAAYLAFGNFLVQAVSFVGFVFIARLLGPRDYGVYVTVGAFVGMFNIFLLQGLGKAVVREGSKNLSSLPSYLERTVGVRNLLILAAMVVCIGASFFTPYEFQTKLYIILFSFDLAYKGITSFLEIIYQSQEKMHYISLFNLLNRFLFVSLSVGFLYLGYGLLSLFLIALFSHMITILIDYRFSRRLVNFPFFSKVHWDKSLLKPAWIFSLFSFVSFLASRIDVVMISFLGTTEEVGIYGIAYKITHQGTMLRNVTSTAFFPILVQQFMHKKIKGEDLIRYSLIFLGAVALVCLVLFFFVEEIVVFLFSAQYQNSASVLKVLIFHLALWWATLPFTTAAQATHNEKVLVVILSLMAALNIPLNYFLFLKYRIMGIAYSTLIVYFLGGIALCLVPYIKMKKQRYII